MSDQHFTDQELLEYLFDCHESPERIEAALEESAELRARLEAARETQDLLAAAAHDESVGPLDFGAPEDEPRAPWLSWKRAWPIVRAAAVAAMLIAALPWAWWAYANARYERLADRQYQVRVEGLPSAPAGIERSLQLTSSNLGSDDVPTEFTWKAFDESGRVLAEDVVSGTGPVFANLPATLEPLRRFEALARRQDRSDASQQPIEMSLGGAAVPPLVHLSTDKPLYRPGETAYLRAVLLDRLTQEPMDGTFRVQVTDPKGAALLSWSRSAEDGVVAGGWIVPENAAGGRYHLQLLSGDGSFAYERLAFEVRRFEPPQLSKKVTLSRRTFAPSEQGSALVAIEKIAGGAVAGAEIKATVLVDGERVWGEETLLDERGEAAFTFDLPDEVLRGEGRFVARVRVGGVVETVVEPFVIPVNDIAANVYPESGALVAGVLGRVYFDVHDAAGRPTSAAGRVVNSRGVRVANFRTEHLGRGRFELTPEPGESYFMEFEVPDSPLSIPLPAAVEHGAVVRVTNDTFEPGQAIVADVEWKGAVPGDDWTAGLFCRGQLVARAEGRGPAMTRVELLPAAKVGGVLRLTLFDGDLQPLAERLVHRESAERIEVRLSPSSSRTLPGEHEVLDVFATDEQGRPVAALIGLTVTDRAVREEAGVARIGLADRAGLFGDLEWDGPALEERGELLRSGDVDEEEHGRRVDLLLGTRGWRRFAWVDREACIAKFGDAGKRLMAREGYADAVDVEWGVVKDREAQREVLRAASRRKRQARDTASAISLVEILLLALTSLWLVLYLVLKGLGARLRIPLGPVTGLVATVMAFFIAGVANDALMPWSRFEAVGVEASMEAPVVPSISDEMLEALRGMGYGADREVAPDPRGLRRVRVYSHSAASGDMRTDFTETVYWNAFLRTSTDGHARVEFDVSDRATTWQIFADAHGQGRVGQGASSFVSVPPVRVEARLPIELTQGDEVQIPVAVTVEGSGAKEDSVMAAIGSAIHGPLRASGALPTSVELVNGEARFLVPIVAEAATGGERARIGLGVDFAGFSDRVVRELRVVPRGFPQRISESGQVGAPGQASGSTEFVIAVPDAPVEGSLRFELKLYPSPIADLLDGADGMLQIPHGCFEQASSTNYPNVLALSYLDAIGASAPAVRAKGRSVLDQGYDLLTGYECSNLGFEWFGDDPGHEVLSAYGLLQFTDMAEVFAVNPEMVARTSEWLLGRRDGKGGFELDPKSLDRFGRAPAPITNAYCTYALAVSGVPAADLAVELDRQAARAAESEDPYEVAAAACALGEAGRAAAADAGRERLKTMQADDGHLAGTTSSITRSGGDDLVVETTAFAVMAWLDDPDDLASAERAMQFLLTRRQAGGRFGSTQATIMALRAITKYARLNRTSARAGEVIVYVNDAEVERIAFGDGAMEAISVPVLTRHLAPGANRLRLELTNGNRFPWAADLRYFAEQPADAPNAAVGLAVTLDRTLCTEGDTVGLDIALTNLTAAGQPMTMAIVGLPASLECATKVLDDLAAAGRFDLWERRGREVILYWRDLAPNAVQEVHLDLVATIPGRTTGPASRAYLYYTPGETRWAEPLAIEVRPLE
ncbi:A-macroglobulin complement component [Planctomycetes bacterium Poly30]|uniref:A-macroglobulin complement component n=1 Tax=Saltatorellus ferox TaxID=2528018 RepID=A0A518ELZ8_9BACT|nr:A-macroglobulin complement component [Planctomycetes bacterium Poly30]